MTHRLFPAVLTCLLCAHCSCVLAQMRWQEDRFVDGRDTMHYLVNYPPGYADSSAVPLVLFLHGGGEGGRDLERVKRNGLPQEIERGRSFPFVTLAPQNRFERGFWDHVMLTYLLDDFVATRKIDPDRIYLTGLSRGGLGAWMLAMHNPGRFAALAPVCGAVPASYDIWIPDSLPIWVFHGTDDDLIHPSESVRMIENLRRKNMHPMPKLTLFEGVGHNSWELAYAGKGLYEWLLGNRLGRE